MARRRGLPDLIRNSGAAFSIGTDVTWIFPVITRRRDRRHRLAGPRRCGRCLGDRVRAGPRRRVRQPGRPAVPRAGTDARPRGRLHQPVQRRRQPLRDLQPGRLAPCPAACARRPARDLPAGTVTELARPADARRRRTNPRVRALDRVTERRSLPVPDGLDGMRLDQAVSRLFGLSRTAAAALVEAGDAVVDGVRVRSRTRSRPVPGWR